MAGRPDPLGDDAQPLRVLLIEDHQLVREGIKLLLDRTPDIAVVGEAADGDSGVRLFARLAAEDGVEVVVTDLGLPDLDGHAVTCRIKALQPDARVLLLTMRDDEGAIRGLLASGADGYLLKEAAAHELPVAIRAVARGETVLSPKVARRLLTQYQRGRERAEYAERLSAREQEVLRLLASGATSKEIARRLGLSTKTVENHRTRILEKLGVANTAAAIGLGYQQGLLHPSEQGDAAH